MTERARIKLDKALKLIDIQILLAPVEWSTAGQSVE